MEFEKSSIERLKRTLYSRDENIVPKEKRTPVAERKIDVSTDWGTTPNFDLQNKDMSKQNNSFFNKFLLGSVAFFLIAIAVAAFIFFGGLNMISSNNLDIKIVAPSSVASGEELVVGLSVVNGNRADLENVAFFINYPEGSQSVGDNRGLSREKIDMGTIPSGGTKEHSLHTILSGEKEVIKTFNFRIEYGVKGSNAVFSKDKIYEVVINSSPIVLKTSYPKEINSGQEITLSIEIISNSNTVIKSSVIKVEYPYGFTFKSSNVQPTRDNSVWSIGDLKNGDKKTISIVGNLVGQNLEDRSFNISAGVQKSSSIVDFDVALASNISTIGIRKSFFDLSVTTQGTAEIGRSVPVTIKWQNILPDKILNSRITATISGNVFDRTAVRVNDGGFYKSIDNSIIWDKNSLASLSSISPGDSGLVTFSLTSLPNSFQTRSIMNPHIIVNVKTTGDRSGTETSKISSEENIIIKFPTSLSLTAKSFRNMGPFTNTGPIPPKADKESTYTITLTLTNTSNDVGQAFVRATIPTGVDWKGETSPLNERLSYDTETRTLTWDVGNISLGAGYINSAREVSFKVGIIPSINQIGITPNLITGLKTEATDTYTVTPLLIESGGVTIKFSDPGFKTFDDIVVK